MRKTAVLFSFVTASLLLTGCLNSSFEDEAKRVKERKEELRKEEKENKNKSEKALNEYYKGQEKPLEEAILENDLDEVKEIDPSEVSEKSKFEDAMKFAQYTSRILYEFYTQQISPEQYYNFLISHGSSNVKEELPSEKDAITILSALQDMYKKRNITGDGYKLTTIEFDRLKRDGTFYRKVSTTNGEEFFITTIIKEDEGWKYVEDSPSPPYILETSENNKQSEQDTITEEEGQ